jgi:hypothetical protein
MIKWIGQIRAVFASVMPKSGVSTFFRRRQPGREGTKGVEYREAGTRDFLPAGKARSICYFLPVGRKCGNNSLDSTLGLVITLGGAEGHRRRNNR